MADRWVPLKQLLEDGLARGVYTAAVACVGWQGELQWQAAAGRVSRDPAASAATLDTNFDLASLTKPLATALALMVLTDAGKLAPEASLGELLPVAWLPPDKRSLTLAQLLAHRAGLPAWEPFYREVLKAPPEARVSLLPRLAAAAPLAQPPDTATLYSDLGFMLLQAVVEAVSGLGLDRFCREQIYRPLGLNTPGFQANFVGTHPGVRPRADTQVRPYYMPPRKPALLMDGTFLARCTTKTPGPPGAWPGTPGSSAGAARSGRWWPPCTAPITGKPGCPALRLRCAGF